jgi:hypothetical protein
MQVDRRDKYQQMHALLNKKQWRQYLALEAKERGSVAQVAQEAQVSQNTIRWGIREVEAGEGYRGHAELCVRASLFKEAVSSINNAMSSMLFLIKRSLNSTAIRFYLHFSEKLVKLA